ncbi:aldehyde dehydrogenase family protein [Psychromicrobium lacuslunae]|uniref:aldehyde dehydrogenase family protein n=1 Tax=Psychromicrobium lacuslunae TaxID=1618207 RepID=UPI0005D312F7|nr:aldehyde dehydrogenase family protein [Psychromicrobium lacuslunae]
MTGLSGTKDDADLVILNPRDGSLVASYPILDQEAVTATVSSARQAASWWAAQDFAARKRLLLAWKAEIARDAETIASSIAAETGKPAGDALLEVMLTLGHLDWAAKNAKKTLRRRRMPAGLMNYNQSASLGYQPFGVVGVIGPWNYPLYTPMGSISYALAAGNAVVFKPSELTPGVATLLAEKWQQVCPEPVFQVVTGDRRTGDVLVRSEVDKVAFTGSTATAKKIMAACAESLTPLVAECGGKDALIVAADADLQAAADFIVFGAMGNAGQTCVGVERVYVEAQVHRKLLELVVAGVAKLSFEGDGAAYGPLTLGSQAEVVSAHVADALERGGRAAWGGPESISGRRVTPIVLTDVPEESLSIQQETFGPTVVINRVESIDDAIARANATAYGLGAAVFTRDKRLGLAIAEQLRAGAVTVNSVLGFASIPALPFGGVGGSGFGRIHGANGLLEFSVAKSIARQNRKAALNLLTMDRSERDMNLVSRLIPLLHGRGKPRN